MQEKKTFDRKNHLTSRVENRKKQPCSTTIISKNYIAKCLSHIKFLLQRHKVSGNISRDITEPAFKKFAQGSLQPLTDVQNMPYR